MSITKPTNTFLGIETSVSGEVKQFVEGASIPTNWDIAGKPYYNPTEAQAQPSNTIKIEPAKTTGKEVPKNGSIIASKNLINLLSDWSNKVPTFANGYYFVGVSGGLALSSDLNNWEYINLFEQLPPSRRNTGFTGLGVANAFAYDSVRKLFICFCENAMFVSTDARNWVVRKQFNNVTLYDYFRLDNNICVVTTSGSNGYLYRTADNWGTWSVVQATAGVSHFNTVLYSGTFVAYGGSNYYKSTDGLNWSTFTVPWSTSYINSFQYLVHAGKLYAIVIYNSTNLTSVYSTTDFTNWTTHTTTLSIGSNSRRCASYAGKIWAIASATTPRGIVNSTDGGTWNTLTIENFDDLPLNNVLSLASSSESVYNINDRLVLRGGSSNKIGQKPQSAYYTSLDGKNWKGCSAFDQSLGVNALSVYSPLVGYNVTVTPSSVPLLKDGNTTYYASNVSFLSSTDGFVSDVTYIGNTTASPSQPRYLVKRNNTFLLFCNNATVVYSLDSGVTWAKVTQTGITNNFPIVQKTSFDTYVIPSMNATSRFFLTVSFTGDTPTCTKSASQLPAGSDANYTYTPQFFVEHTAGTYTILGKKTLTTNSGLFSWFKYSSVDQGVNWTIDETPITFNGITPSVNTCFTYGGKVFACTSAGFYQSTDLINWTLVPGFPKVFTGGRPVFLADRVVFGFSNFVFWSKDGNTWYNYDIGAIGYDNTIPAIATTSSSIQSVTSDSEYVYFYFSGNNIVRYSKNDTTGKSATLLTNKYSGGVSTTNFRGVQIGESYYVLNNFTLFSSSDRMKTWNRLATFGSTGYSLFTDEKYLYVLTSSNGNGDVSLMYKVCPSSGAYETIQVAFPYLSDNNTVYGYAKNNLGSATNGAGTLVIGMSSSGSYTGRVLVSTNYGQAYQVVELPGSPVSSVAWHMTYFEGYFYTGNAGSAAATDYWKSADGITWTKETRFNGIYPIYFYRAFSKLFAVCYRDGQYLVYEVPDINVLSGWISRGNLGVRCYAPYFTGQDADDTTGVSYAFNTSFSIYPIGEFGGYFYAVLGSGMLAKSSDGYVFELVDYVWGGNHLLFLEDRLVNLGYTSSRTDAIEIPFRKVTTPNQYVVNVEPVNTTTYVYRP